MADIADKLSLDTTRVKRFGVYICTGLALLVVGIWVSQGAIQLALLSAAVSVLALSILVLTAHYVTEARKHSLENGVYESVRHDPDPTFLCDNNGHIKGANIAARDQLSVKESATIEDVLRRRVANAEGLLRRVKRMADNGVRPSSEEVVLRNGVLRVSAHSAGRNLYIWRLLRVSQSGNCVSRDQTDLPMVMVDRSGKVLYTNDSARALIGVDATSLDTLFETQPVVLGAINRINTQKGLKDVLLSRVDSGAGRYAMYLLPPPDAIQPGAWQAFQDLPVPLVRLSVEGEIEAYNRMATALVGSDLALGKPFGALVEGLGRPMRDWLYEAAEGRAVQQSEFMRVKREDKETFIQVALKRLADGGDRSVLAVLTDATELKTLEAQFVQSQKMQAIGQLAGGVAHDFNNLLTAISGHCDLLLLRHDQGDADYSDLIQINQNANRAAALVGQLLAFSRKQTLSSKELSLRDTMSDLTHLLNRLVGEKVTLELSHDPVLKTIRADKRQLEQVVMNLVVNARDAMPEGGTIKIETECVTLSEPLQRDRATVPAGEYVCLRVIDEGTGIPKDKLQKIFEPFYSTKRTGEGTGLGLSTAYGIVKQTGGFIFVDSALDKGTKFTLMFPVWERSATDLAPQPVVQKEIPAERADGAILLVEDEAPVRAFASRALQLRGYTVIEADSGEAALETLEDDGLEIDLFVSDVIMPGIDGPTWVKQALTKRPKVPVVFMSGYTEDKLQDRQETIPNSVFLPKPFSLVELTDAVHNQLS